MVTRPEYYIGCTNETQSNYNITFNPMFSYSCIDHCTKMGFLYAGTTNSSICLCLNSFKENLNKTSNSCKCKCQNSTDVCGCENSTRIHQALSKYLSKVRFQQIYLIRFFLYLKIVLLIHYHNTIIWDAL